MDRYKFPAYWGNLNINATLSKVLVGKAKITVDENFSLGYEFMGI